METTQSQEVARLEELHHYQMLGVAGGAEFEQFTDIAAQCCGTQMALITLLDHEYPWVVAASGPPVQAKSRTDAFCALIVATKSPLVVPDTLLDPRFATNPLVTGVPQIRFYAGVPLISPRGLVLGALEVGDDTPRDLLPTQLSSLTLLAEKIMAMLERRRVQSQPSAPAVTHDPTVDQLEVSNERLIETFESITDAFVMLDTAWRFTYVNHVAASLAQRKATDVLGKTLWEAYPHLIGTESETHYRRAVTEQISVEFEEFYPPRGRWLEVRAFPSKAGLAIYFRDITRRRQSDQRLTLLKTWSGRLNDIVMITALASDDPGGAQTLYVNEAFHQKTGYRYDPERSLLPIAASSNNAALLEDPLLHGARRIERLHFSPTGRPFWIEEEVVAIAAQHARPACFQSVIRDITERKQAEAEAAQTNLALHLLKRSNEALLRCETEAELLSQVCQIAVDAAHYAVAWVGLAQDDPQCSIEVVAYAGLDDASPYFSKIALSWSDQVATGRGPAGQTVRSGMPVICDDFELNPEFAPWLGRAREHGFRSGVFLPLKNKDRTFGVLGLYRAEVQQVHAQQIALLLDLANDLSFGIGNVRIQAERLRIQAASQQQASLLDHAADTIIVCAIDGRILYCNEGAARQYGMPRDELVGSPLSRLVASGDNSVQQILHACETNGTWQGEAEHQRVDGGVTTVEGRATLVRNDDGAPRSVFIIFTDISARKAAERKIHWLAFYDTLTGLPNRQFVIEQLRLTLAQFAHTDRHGALLLVGLDSFKNLNDTAGHETGDRLLRQVAIRIAECVPPTAKIARVGGDEFLVMLDAASPLDAPIQAVTQQLGEALLKTLAEPYRLDGFNHVSTASIGAVQFTTQSDTGSELLQWADLALIEAKLAGRNTLRFFDPLMQERISSRAALIADLRPALQGNQFLLHYQPQIDVEGQVFGVEALLRWHHPVRGNVSPAEFIPASEEIGLINALGQWVLETACAQLADWARDPATSKLSIAVNVSAHQFKHPEFVELVKATLARAGAAPSQLKLELTESLLADDINIVIEKMLLLKTAGVGFSLDDFGTGYSSLSYLRRMPLDQLKIDQSFVRHVLTDTSDATIARTIVALGKSLGLQVIAEGVETIEQRAFLKENGCFAYQGYFFSKPLAIAPLMEFLRTQRRRFPPRLA